MRRILAALICGCALASCFVHAAPAEAAAALDSLLITPQVTGIRPPNPTVDDSVFIDLAYCDPCAILLSNDLISSGYALVRLSHRVPAPGDSCARACPWPTTQIALGRRPAGAQTIILDTFADIVEGNTVTGTLHSRIVVNLDVAVSPPPPPGPLPYVRDITVGANPFCDLASTICPNDSILVQIEGVFPDDCHHVRRVDLIQPLYLRGPGPTPPIVRILVDDGGCLGRPCVLGNFGFSVSATLPGLPPGAYLLPVEVGTASCTDTFPSDTTVHSLDVPFAVAEQCSTGTFPLCVRGAWQHPNGRLACDDMVARDHPAHVEFIARSGVALSGLQGRFIVEPNGPLRTGAAKPAAQNSVVSTALDVTAIEPIGPAAGMHLQWNPTPEGARFVLFADAGAPIPADSNDPIFRVTVAQRDTGFVWPSNLIWATDLLGADSTGAAVPGCLFPCVSGATAIICTTPHDCDVNHDGALDVRDLVTMVHCVLGTGPCPDSAASAFDCNGDGTVNLDDVLCCGSVILQGHLPDSTLGRPEPGISASFGDPMPSAGGVDVPLTLIGGNLFAAARLELSFPTGSYDFAGVGMLPAGGNWLELHQQDGDHLVVGLIQTGPSNPVLIQRNDPGVHLTLHFTPKSGTDPNGMVTVVRGDFSGSDGAALAVNLGQPAQVLGDGPIGLSAIQPNPFGSETRFAVRLARAARVELDVHDLVGRRVTTLYRGSLSAGARVFTWDGRDAGGTRVANGMYFVRLTVDGKASARKVTLVRTQ